MKTNGKTLLAARSVPKTTLKSADLACEFHGVISEPGAKTLAWPRGRRGGSAREGGRGGRGGGGGGGPTLFYSGVPGGPDSPLGTKFYALK